MTIKESSPESTQGLPHANQVTAVDDDFVDTRRTPRLESTTTTTLPPSTAAYHAPPPPNSKATVTVKEETGEKVLVVPSSGSVACIFYVFGVLFFLVCPLIVFLVVSEDEDSSSVATEDEMSDLGAILLGAVFAVAGIGMFACACQFMGTVYVFRVNDTELIQEECRRRQRRRTHKTSTTTSAAQNDNDDDYDWKIVKTQTFPVVTIEQIVVIRQFSDGNSSNFIPAQIRLYLYGGRMTSLMKDGWGRDDDERDWLACHLGHAMQVPVVIPD